MNIKNVAIFFGGNSDEKNISINSGFNVYKVLLKHNINVYPINIKYFSLEYFFKKKIDKVFILLHGKIGEDGIIQGFLDFLNIPYTGSKIFASSLSINKFKTKIFLKNFNFNLLPDLLLKKKNLFKEKKLFKLFNDIIDKLNLPFIIKPNDNGSSIGLKLIKNFLDFKIYFKNLQINNIDYIVEKYIIGRECTVCVLDGKVLCPIEIIYKNKLFNYNEKYKFKNKKYLEIKNKNIKNKLIFLSSLIWNNLSCKGCIRIDYIIDKYNNIWFLEINTIPGMTNKSLVSICASFSNISYDNLILRILNS